MTRLALSAILMLATPAYARPLSDRINDLPVAAEATYCGLAVADSTLTASILDRGGYERNPMYGRHPAKGTLAAIAVGKCIGHAAFTSFLQDHASPRAVRIWEHLSIGIQGGVVVSNFTVRF